MAKIRSLKTARDLAQDADYLGDMTVADFEAMLQQALAPLIKELDIAGKLGGPSKS